MTIAVACNVAVGLHGYS